MVKSYISVSFSKRKDLSEAIDTIKSVMKEFNVEPFIFVDQYRFEVSQEKEMMQRALADIDDADLFIAETTDKAIGIGIEAGYAKGRNKPVIYIRRSDAEHSTTLSGISDYQVLYNDAHDLYQKLHVAMKIIALQGGK